MAARGETKTELLPVHVGYEQCPAEEYGEMAEQPARPGWGRRRSALRGAAIEWERHGLVPRWIGMETSDCVAALDPSIFHSQGAAELERFLAGAAARSETAVVVAAIGDINDETPTPLFSGGSSLPLPGLKGSIGGARVPRGARPRLADGVGAAERDLGLRLLNTGLNAWWSLSLSGLELQAGAGGPAEHHEPEGRLEPVLIDGLGNPVVATWIPAGGDQRWFVIPAGSDWNVVLAWLAQRAVPEYVPQALRRLRSPRAEDPDLQSDREAAARKALAELDAQHAESREVLARDLAEASNAAEPVRYGLLYGTGAELVAAVAVVFEAAGLAPVDLDELLADTASADLLVTYNDERRLVEVKSSSGAASEKLVADLERHLKTWPQLRPDSPVGGGVLVVNHQRRIEPAKRSPDVYQRALFVAALTVPVLSSRQLFNWWRQSNWAAVRDAVLGPPAGPHEGAELHKKHGSSAPSAGGTRRWLRGQHRD